MNDFLNSFHDVLKLVLDINLEFNLHGFELVLISVVAVIVNVCTRLNLMFLANKLVNLFLLGLNGALVDVGPRFHLISHQFHFGVYLHDNLLLTIVLSVETFLPNLLDLLRALLHFRIQIFVARINLQLVFNLILQICDVVRLEFLLLGELSFKVVKLTLQLF